MRFLVALAFLGAACGPGTLSSGPECPGPGCPDADPCVGGDCDGSPGDPCDTLVCPSGQECVGGRCRDIDRCRDVTCENPGEACDPRDGTCRPGSADEDGDGYTIAGGDCDDSDPARHPAKAEDCDGVDQDCDLDVDEGILARPCSTECGEGEMRCERGTWSLCSSPEECGCTPAGRTESEACGLCGMRTRTCGDDLAWSDWGRCTGETGECTPGSTDSETCGACGERTRTCDGDCRWGELGACLGETGECTPGAPSSCSTSCGSTGSRTCGDGCSWGPCTAPAETCNADDDDCDGACDEGCRIGVHRSYSAAGSDHFYTADAAEAGCCGYTLEFSNYFHLSATSVPGTTALHRCYSAAENDHMVTASSTCEDAAGWILEGTMGFVAVSATCGAVPLYRLVGFTDHFFTVSAAERDSAAASGYLYEGIAGHVWLDP
jgi:hypothetical protein